MSSTPQTNPSSHGTSEEATAESIIQPIPDSSSVEATPSFATDTAVTTTTNAAVPSLQDLFPSPPTLFSLLHPTIRYTAVTHLPVNLEPQTAVNGMTTVQQIMAALDAALEINQNDNDEVLSYLQGHEGDLFLLPDGPQEEDDGEEQDFRGN